MGRLEDQLASVLNKRQQIAKRRQLVVNSANAIDFSSNDFLGLAQNSVLRKRYLDELNSLDTVLGSTGSRLLDGNSQYAIDLEQQIAKFHGADSALLFNSGFDANTGLFSTLPQKGDIVIYDELVHASVHEGMRVSRAGRLIPFKHSDVADLDRVLIEIGYSTDKNVFIAVETVYSMDGDVAPLVEIVQLLRKYWPERENGYIIVDEAHATGVYGESGRGVVCQLGLEKEIFARLHTFGKSLASSGAAVLGSNTLRDYLINYARPLIYSTFLPFSSLASIKCSYDFLECGETLAIQRHLHTITRQFREAIRLPTGTLLPSDSPIQGIVLNGNAPVRALAGYLNKRGFIVKPICSPTVPKGQERVRICLHGHNTIEQIDSLVSAVHEFFNVEKHNSIAPSASALEPAKL
ncbi:pyridoxal phosphate-dependent transferase [Zychaea mexicana]|uniref:pyridoxal phosphate-dependent transferase n=1 Tax=Zychaea mexicana TaxID=64656 RepID=UPI0022FE6FF7|nr:pyridoxal phosphate-dependent transferase [Zychaea mexicana]KAI9484671.1 pyridoxal phosphate-dependent transferase [Zychaea mexicana]